MDKVGMVEQILNAFSLKNNISVDYQNRIVSHIELGSLQFHYNLSFNV